MRLVRCVPCVAFVLALVCAAFAAQASPGPLSTISGDGLLALVGTVLFSMLAGYAKGQERRITALEKKQEKNAPIGRVTLVEQEQRQIKAEISLFRETVFEKHPSRPEMNQLREDINGRFDRLERMIEARH